MDCSPPGSSVHGGSPGKNTGVGCHALLQEILPIQGSNPGLPHCRWILHGLSHQRSPTEGDTRNKWSSPKKSKLQLKWQVYHNHKQCKIKCTLAYISIQLLRAKILSGKEEIRKGLRTHGRIGTGNGSVWWRDPRWVGGEIMTKGKETRMSMTCCRKMSKLKEMVTSLK